LGQPFDRAFYGIRMRYFVATLQGYCAPFALVRTSEGTLTTAFGPGQRPLVEAAVEDQLGELPIACLAREANGYKFDAPPEIRNDVGLLLEDRGFADIHWEPLALEGGQTPNLPDQPTPPIAA
jgi:hypothetical protein